MQTAMNNGVGAAMEMPRYQSHKKVWALKIREIVPMVVDVSTAGMRPDGAMLYPEDKRYSVISVDQAYMEKHLPFIGGYYVVYDDGYKSFSPADVFEAGYTLIK